MDAEILRMIVEIVRKRTGAQRWRFVQVCLAVCTGPLVGCRLRPIRQCFVLTGAHVRQGSDENALVDFTIVRHIQHGTVLQVAHFV